MGVELAFTHYGMKTDWGRFKPKVGDEDIWA
jgi:hypothetical protein